MSELSGEGDVPGTDAARGERLVLNCPDRPGIVAAVTTFLARHGANILDLDQHSDTLDGRFAMRVIYAAAPGDLAAIRAGFRSEVAGALDMEVRIAGGAERRRVAILCSREDHCLLDLLWRFRGGELQGEVVGVLSTVDGHEGQVRGFGVGYETIGVGEGGMAEHEAALLERLAGRVDLVVLARYMRVLSAGFLERLGCPAINIHHSFLPAFAGAEPYARAHARGVKLIGATAHYVTAELDQGPIIEQDVVRVTHRMGPADLQRIGRDVERVVLARAVRAHLEDRVVVWGERTVVF